MPTLVAATSAVADAANTIIALFNMTISSTVTFGFLPNRFMIQPNRSNGCLQAPASAAHPLKFLSRS
jgi:hypothetical protein